MTTPNMPQNLDNMYDDLVADVLSFCHRVAKMLDYGVSAPALYAEVQQRIKTTNGFPEMDPDVLKGNLEAMMELFSVPSDEPAELAIRTRLQRAYRETGGPAVECSIMLRSGGGFRGSLTQDIGGGLKMLCPDMGTPGMFTEVHFGYGDIAAVGFPTRMTVDGSKIRLS